MSILTNSLEPKAKSISFNSDELLVELKDGRRLSVPLAYFPRLIHATPEQRNNYEFTGEGAGLHWESIDEDISVMGLLNGQWDQTNHLEKDKKRSA